MQIVKSNNFKFPNLKKTIRIIFNLINISNY